MAQSDVFNFLITPDFDVSNLDQASGELTKRIKNISNNLADIIKQYLKVDLSQVLDVRDISQVSKYVESIGGSVKRTGTDISASFKDANGNVVTFSKSLQTAAEHARDALIASKQYQGNVDEARKIYNDFVKSTVTYTGADQIKQQNELEQQIIKSVQERYNLENKITDAKASGNTANEAYYTQLRNIAITEEQQLQSQYRGSQENITAKKQQLSLEQQLYQQKVNSQTADKQSNQEQQKLVSTVKDYVKQYQTLQSLESKGQQNTQAYKDTQAAMQSLISTLKQYGVEIQTDNNGTQQFVVVQKNAENQAEKVASALRDGNVALLNHNENQNKLTNSIQQSVENFIKYQVAMEAINKITSEFTSAIYDMNEAMTQVRMVTMGSYEDTVALADSYTQLAKQLGTTTTTVAEGADAWLKMSRSSKIPLIAGNSCNMTISSQGRKARFID